MGEIPSYDITPVHEKYSERAVKAIGALFLASATSETALMIMLAKLQCHPSRATLHAVAVIQGMANKVMLQKITEILRLIAPEQARELSGICDKIRRIFEHRNNLAHYSALMGGGDNFTINHLKLGSVEKIYSSAQVEEYTDRLSQLVRHLSERLLDLGLTQRGDIEALAPLGLEDPSRHSPQPNGK